MDSVFGIGAPEIVVILLLAGIVMGPHRIRQVALWLGKTTATLQSISRGFVRQLNAELDAVDGSGDLRGTMEEVKQLRQQVRDLRRELTSSTMSPINESKQILKESQQMVEQSIAPPSLKSIRAGAAEDGQQASSTPQAPSTPSELPKPVEVPDDPEQ